VECEEREARECRGESAHNQWLQGSDQTEQAERMATTANTTLANSLLQLQCTEKLQRVLATNSSQPHTISDHSCTHHILSSLVASRNPSQRPPRVPRHPRASPSEPEEKQRREGMGNSTAPHDYIRATSGRLAISSRWPARTGSGCQEELRRCERVSGLILSDRALRGGCALGASCASSSTWGACRAGER